MEAISQAILDFTSTISVEDYTVTEWSNGDGVGGGEGMGKACGGVVLDGIGLGSKALDSEHLEGLYKYDGHVVYHLDNLPVILYTVIGNAAYGALIKPDMTIEKGIIARYGNSYAFAPKARDAYNAARELSIKRGWEHFEKDPVAFMLKNYPDPDMLVDRKVLLELHNVLTGSCIDGRKDFIKENNISLEGTMTLRDFFQLCKYTFGREILAKVAAAYDINI